MRNILNTLLDSNKVQKTENNDLLLVLRFRENKISLNLARTVNFGAFCYCNWGIVIIKKRSIILCASEEVLVNSDFSYTSVLSVLQAEFPLP